MKNAHYTFPEPKAMYSDCLFFLTDSPKIKYIQFIITYDKENPRIWELLAFSATCSNNN